MECQEESPKNDDKDKSVDKVRSSTRKMMLEHLSTNEKVFFKTLNEGEELDMQEKIDIAGELLDRSYGLFLAKFGNYLLQDHLSYFEDRTEEDSLIVDLHLKQINRALKQKNEKKHVTKPTKNTSDASDMAAELNSADKSRLALRNQMLDHISLSTEAHFRSQQINEPDLERREKRDIAEAVLDRSASTFLSRFGTHLLVEHLSYFDHHLAEDYEVEYHLKQLRKNHCKVISQVGIKNRRFEALKKMIEKGTYFCETEMRNRNPLLYEQLVGKYLSPEERHERLNNIDTTNITFVNLLLEQMDRAAVKKLKKEQEEAENDAMEEEEDSSEEGMEEDDDSEEDNNLDKTLWGETYTDSEKTVQKRPVKKEEKQNQEPRNEEDLAEVSDLERQLLLEEFRTNMFSSFLEGKDVDFDYSQVDNNSDYDDLEAQAQDEEEKYFDEESSQDAISNKMSDGDEESSQDANSNKMSDGEDMLDQYMSGLKPQPTTQQLTDKMSSLTHEEALKDENVELRSGEPMRESMEVSDLDDQASK